MDNEEDLNAFDALLRSENNKFQYNRLKSLRRLKLALDGLTIDEYQSMIFLLIEYLEDGIDEFLFIIKKDETYIRQKLEETIKKVDDDSILIELLGTMKMYEKLKTLDTCHHVYEKLLHQKFNKMKVWKLFYSLCEELTEIDLECLRQLLPNDEIKTAEEWFCIALQQKLISKTDFSMLEKIFHNYENILEIIKNFVKPKSYDIRTPDTNTHCGLAVIFNYEIFKEKYTKREGSCIDVKSLEQIWDIFGFKTTVYNNLTFDETLTTLKYYAELDHSNYDAFVCCILSHGHPNIVISSDEKHMQIPRLIGEITDKCSSLYSKPKLFFIQACQGLNIQQGFGKPVYKLQYPDVSESITDLYVPPIASDVLLAISSIHGYVSFRDKEAGSWFIQDFCSVMKQKGDKFSILDVIIEVNNNVRERHADLGPNMPRNAQQIVNCHNTFGKILILKKKIAKSL